MGFKKTNAFWLIQSGSMTSTNVITSSAQNIQNFDNIALEISWTGTPTGTFALLASVSESIPNATGTFYTLTSPSLTNPSGSAGGYVVSLNQFPYPYIQFKYTNATGSGTLNVYLFSKDLN